MRAVCAKSYDRQQIMMGGECERHSGQFDVSNSFISSVRLHAVQAVSSRSEQQHGTLSAAPAPAPALTQAQQPNSTAVTMSETAAVAAAGGVANSCLARLNLTVAAVLFVFLFLYGTSVTCVILPWLSYSVPGVMNLLVLSVTTGFALSCYFGCMITDPGRVPAGWQPDEELQSATVQEVKKKGGMPRYCKKCSQFKPPRSHHCRVCERCVLRMDHHCPWVNNCIGHANYRSFFLLLVYCSAALVHTTGLLLSHAVHIIRSSGSSRVIRVGPGAVPHSLGESDSPHLLTFIGLQTFALAVALPTTIAVVMLLIWHIQMVVSNKTTIEHAEGVTAQIKSATFGQDRQRHPYDLGWHDNLHDILGDDALTWCIPSMQPTPGGTVYRTAFDNQQSLLGF